MKFPLVLIYGPWTHLCEVDKAGVYLGPAASHLSVWALVDGWVEKEEKSSLPKLLESS